MVHWVQPSPTTNRIVTTTILGIAQCLTCFRIYLRARTKRIWWDDGWAFLTMIFTWILTTAMWIRTTVDGLGPFNVSHSSRIVAYWLVTIFFTTSLWSARMSMIFSVIRLIPEAFVLRRISQYTAVLFFLVWAGSLSQKVYVCTSDRSWEQESSPQCHLGIGVAIYELVADIFADIALAVIPIHLLRGVGMSAEKRIMLHAMFGASLLISAVSIVHAIFLLGPSGLFEAITAQAESGTALLVSNFATLTPYVYRLLKTSRFADSYIYYPSFHDGQVYMRRIPRPRGNTDSTRASTVVFNTEALGESIEYVDSEAHHLQVTARKSESNNCNSQSEASGSGRNSSKPTIFASENESD